ncbi:protein GVQW3-like, partial [Contarinia nasturtii]|uniref:protein GVQW3-like n=1 Tax=Contarinia nasturtii TaxID=265458 RepID=UPI0012D3A6F0
MDKIEYRAVIKFLTKEGSKNGQSFKLGRESLKDDPHTGRPVKATAPDVLEKIDHLVHENPRMSKKVLAAMFDISTGSVFNILHEKLHMRKVCSRWIPRTSNRAQKEERIAAA